MIFKLIGIFFHVKIRAPVIYIYLNKPETQVNYLIISQKNILFIVSELKKTRFLSWDATAEEMLLLSVIPCLGDLTEMRNALTAIKMQV